MATSFNRLPEGALVLVTGATGYIGSAVVDTLLRRGYRVRATTRSQAKAELWKQYFVERYDGSKVDFVAFTEYTTPEGYDKVLDGIDGVVHLATDTSFGSSFKEVVEGSTAASLSLLRAATNFRQIKSVILTSSTIAAFKSETGKNVVLDQSSYNDIVNTARVMDVTDTNAGWAMYAASKVESERQAWAYVREAAPHYAFNTVLPGFVVGPDCSPEPSATTGAWLTKLFQGEREGTAATVLGQGAPFVDVRDIAALHVAALLDSKTEGQRLWGMPQKVDLNDILATWRAAFPDRNIVGDYDLPPRPKIVADESQSDRLIESWQGTWTDWKVSVVDSVKSV